MRRKRLSRRVSMRHFRRNSGTHSANIRRKAMRGGVRL